MRGKSIDYLLSLHILRGLKDNNLISDKEFELIDLENKKSFQVIKNQAFDLINF